MHTLLNRSSRLFAMIALMMALTANIACAGQNQMAANKEMMKKEGMMKKDAMMKKEGS